MKRTVTSHEHLGLLHLRQASPFVDLSVTLNWPETPQQLELLTTFFFSNQLVVCTNEALTAKLSKQEQEVDAPVQVVSRMESRPVL